MAVPLRIVEPTKGPGWSVYDQQAGDMWLCDWEAHKHTASGRTCYVVRLPGGAYAWHTCEISSTGKPWTVTGEAPNITVNPSINVGPEIWHGWIKNGELTPDTDSTGRP